jgi:hypothetical protein
MAFRDYARVAFDCNGGLAIEDALLPRAGLLEPLDARDVWYDDCVNLKEGFGSWCKERSQKLSESIPQFFSSFRAPGNPQAFPTVSQPQSSIL